MTRAEKLWRIQTYHPSLYSRLQRAVPQLISNPDEASSSDISIYNELISEESHNENNPSFRKRFSF